MLVFKRGARGLMMLVLLLGSVLATPARADTANDLEHARARLAAAQSAADAAAARYERALQRDAALSEQLAQTQLRISAAETRERGLRRAVQAIAVQAYVQAAEPTGPTVLFAGNDVLDLGRSTRLLDRANAPNLETIDKLVTVQGELDRDRTHLRETREASKKLLKQLDEDGKRVQSELVAAGNATEEIQARLAREQQAAAAAREAQARALAAATSTTSAPRATAREDSPTVAAGDHNTNAPPTTSRPSPPPPPDDPPPPPPPPPPVSTGKVLCPIRGPVSFVDSWHAPRSGGRLHEGVDIMAPMGSINQAVVSGTIDERFGARQGNGIFLFGDDGNSYWYFHLSAYAGGPRHVSRGEVIGYTGMTGNADGTVPHTHFEYHPGHGDAANPYPLVKKACG